MIYDDAAAAGYDRGRYLRPQDIDAWMTAARPYLPGADGRVLDLGAGTGRFTTALARTCGAMVVAGEPSAAMRAVCRANWPQVAIVGATAQAAPFAAHVFDAVWASQMIHHVGDLRAFAASLRRIVKPGGHLLLRGGFGPPDGLPLFRYFPQAWATGTTVTLSLAEISEALATAGIELTAHLTVDQVLAESAEELLGRVRTRSLSNLAALADVAFQAGVHALESDVAGARLPHPIVERLDLVVYRTAI